jgi:DNA polymerase
MAASLFRVPVEQVTSEQRRIGKNLVLGCGYGLGHVKFVEYSDKAGVTIDEKFSRMAVTAYRETHPAVVAYWGTLQRAFTHVVQHRTTVTAHRCEFGWWRGWVYIQLPSGRRLYYFDARAETVPGRNGMPSTALSYDSSGGEHRDHLYGGKIAENIVQAVARDMMVNGMWNAERAGYPVVGTVHDEVLSERPHGQGTVEEYVSALCRLPRWAGDCPISAEGFETVRYRKG